MAHIPGCKLTTNLGARVPALSLPKGPSHLGTCDTRVERDSILTGIPQSRSAIAAKIISASVRTFSRVPAGTSCAKVCPHILGTRVQFLAKYRVADNPLTMLNSARLNRADLPQLLLPLGLSSFFIAPSIAFFMLRVSEPWLGGKSCRLFR